MNRRQPGKMIIEGASIVSILAVSSIAFGIAPAQTTESEYFKTKWECERAESLLDISDSIVKPCTETRVGWYLVHV